MKLISIGDNVTDTYVNEEIYYPGGNCVNVAVDARKAGAENSDYLGIFGDDKRAQNIKDALQLESVNLVNCRKVYAPSAAPQVLIDASGDRVFASGPKGSSQHLFKLRLTPDDIQKLSGYDVMHTSVYSNLESDLEEIKKYTKVSFDFSENQEKTYLNSVLPFVNFAFFSGSGTSMDEVKSLGKFCFRYSSVEVVSVTRGGDSAVLMSRDGLYEQETVATEIRDTMGAGDSFIGGFLVGYIDFGDLAIAGLKGAQNAASTCKINGGFGHPFSIKER